MDSNQPLFSLSIDPVTKEHLSETAKWARFLSICGMIFLVMGIILGVGYGIFLSSMMDNSAVGGMSPASDLMGVFFAVYMLVISIVWFFPLLYLFRFSGRLRSALNGNDQVALNTAFQNLKMCMRYVGIVTIILVILTLLSIVLGILGLASMSA